MTTSFVVQPLVDLVRSVQSDEIELPILRDLVRDIQTKSPDEMRQDSQYWTDTNWQQWRQHSSHNPW
jgi:hypothetical protein